MVNKKTITVKKTKNTKNKERNRLKINKNDWVLSNKKRFPKWINEMFHKYLITNDIKHVNSKDFKPFMFQKIVRDFMQNDSPYRGLLLYHGLGSGKTCTSIIVAENLKNFKNILVMLPASIKNNFIEKGLLYCGDKRYQALPSLIEEHYAFVSTNASNTYKQLQERGSLDNHVIIIDEVHNLVSRMVSGLMGQSKQGKQIYELLMNAKNCKIIALTGTPIINFPIEAGILLNIIRGQIEVHIFRIIKIQPNLDIDNYKSEIESIPGIDFTEINIINQSIEVKLLVDRGNNSYDRIVKKFEDTSMGLGIEVKYLIQRNYTAFPETSEEFDKYFLDATGKGAFRLKNKNLFIRRSLGLISYYESMDANYPVYKINMVDLTMSNYQFILYERVREVERVRERLAARKMRMGSTEKPTSLMRIYSRMFSNFVFPKEIPRPFRTGDLQSITSSEAKNVEKDMLKEELTNENQEKLTKDYKRRIISALKKLDLNRERYLKLDKLEKYSPKMKKMLETINQSPGLVLVYSQFRTLEGIGVFEIVLKANGYEQFGEKGKNQKYAIYSGEEDDKYKKEVLKTFNSYENREGKKIKVLMITSAGAEGLDLKNIRQIHIMEPYWNEVREKQVVGRGVRHNSHKDLKPADRNIEVYRYFALMSPKNTAMSPEKLSTDQYVYSVALKKKGITDDIEELFKEIAVDCVLNKGATKLKTTCFSFGTDEMGLSYLPDISKDSVYSATITQSKKVKRKLVLAYLTNTNKVVIPDKKTRKVYSIINFNKKKNALKKVPKIVKKIRVDMNTKIIYDKTAGTTGELIKVGKYNNKGNFVR